MGGQLGTPPTGSERPIFGPELPIRFPSGPSGGSNAQTRPLRPLRPADPLSFKQRTERLTSDPHPTGIVDSRWVGRHCRGGGGGVLALSNRLGGNKRTGDLAQRRLPP